VKEMERGMVVEETAGEKGLIERLDPDMG